MTKIAWVLTGAAAAVVGVIVVAVAQSDGSRTQRSRERVEPRRRRAFVAALTPTTELDTSTRPQRAPPASSAGFTSSQGI
jgi:hypothetical protein